MPTNLSLPHGLDNMKTRLMQRGGYPQQLRMIKDKRETLNRAVLYSYQGAQVKTLNLGAPIAPALINPNKTKQDYDDKIISIGYEFDYKPGTVFEWVNTGTKWLIYLQDLTELAYFKGDIRRCNYQISWEDEDNNIKSTYAAIRGPVETKITYLQKAGISVDTPNMSLDILMPKNEDTLKYFSRYSKFYLKGLEEGDRNLCWRVESLDSISMPGVLEVCATEYYSNEIEDDIENGIVGGLIPKHIDPDPALSAIKGPGFIKPRRTYEFTFEGEEEGTWEINSKALIKKTIEGKTISILWTENYSGQFTIKYGSVERVIVVESLY